MRGEKQVKDKAVPSKEETWKAGKRPEKTTKAVKKSQKREKMGEEKQVNGKEEKSKQGKAGRGWENEWGEEEIHLKSIWNKVEKEGGRNLKSTEVRKGKESKHQSSIQRNGKKEGEDTESIEKKGGKTWKALERTQKQWKSVKGNQCKAIVEKEVGKTGRKKQAGKIGSEKKST